MLKLTKDQTGVAAPRLQPDYELYQKVLKGEVKVSDDVKKFLHLCTCFLDGVYVSWAKQPENGNWKTFNGQTIPSLNFKFIGVSKDGAEPAQYIHSISSVDPGGMFRDGKSSVHGGFDAILRYTQHFANVVLGKGIDAEIDVPTTDKGRIDVEAFKQYDTERVVKVYADLFTTIAAAFNTKDKDGNDVCKGSDIKLRAKLTVQQYDNNKFGFNSFGPGTGVIERYNEKSTTLALDPVNDTIIPTPKQVATATAMPGMAPAGAAPGNVQSAINLL